MTGGRKIVQLQVKKMTAENGWEFFWLFAVCDDGTLWERMCNTKTDTEQHPGISAGYRVGIS
jgi:hypothetical protein